MTSKDSGRDEDQELLDRYRRASDSESSAPSDAVRAAILAEGRRVAEQLARKNAQPLFDSSRPAANDFRWKIPAFGTLGAALLAALLFAPRYWETLPAGKATTAQLAAPDSAGKATTAQLAAPDSVPPAAPPPNLEYAAPIAPSEPPQEVVVTQANRKRSDPQAEAAAKASAAAPKDRRLANAPPVAAPAPQNFSAAQKYGAPQAPALADAAPPERSPPAASARSAAAAYNSADSLAGGARIAPTPARLQSAAAAGDLAQASTLLDQGAAVDASDAQGRTPLMLAIAQGRLEIVRLLLQRGANPNIADNSGETPLQLATDRNLKDILALLQNAGAH